MTDIHSRNITIIFSSWGPRNQMDEL